MAIRQRWEDTLVRIFVDGVEIANMKAVDFDYHAMTQFQSTKYAGDTLETKDTDYKGFGFSLTTELIPGAGDPEDAYEAFIAGVKQRTATGSVLIVVSYRVPGTTTRASRRFIDCQLDLRFRGATGRPNQRTLTGEARDSIPG